MDRQGSNHVAEENLVGPQRGRIADSAVIRALFVRVTGEGIELVGGLNRLTERRRARILSCERKRVTIAPENFGKVDGPLLLAFELDRTAYSFLGNPVWEPASGTWTMPLPSVIYERERREGERRDLRARADGPKRVALSSDDGRSATGMVVDLSRNGVGVEVPESWAGRGNCRLRMVYLDGDERGREAHGTVCHSSESRHHRGWVRLGLRVSSIEQKSDVRIERRESILVSPKRRFGPGALSRALVRGARVATRRARGNARNGEAPRVVDFRNRNGERLRSLIDGANGGAPVVIVPPAWGRTKETLAPLSLAILETFRAAGEGVTILRYDGVRRRGESHNDASCMRPGSEYLAFTVSQAIEDLRAAVHFARTSPELRASRLAIVTTSVASVEARRALASDWGRAVDGWVSLVGVADLQSALSIFSGGIDFARGLAEGVRFGVQELLGVPCDVDRLVGDAISERLWYLEDARQDMARITVPVTWIHGRFDAWQQFERVRDVLECGSSTDRQLIEIPTGHQLRTSDDALGAFALVAAEVGRIALGRALQGVKPSDSVVQERQRAERRRLPPVHFDLRRFWRDYLVGRTGEVGIQLLTATSAYRELMDTQIAALDLKPAEIVADLGAGVGDFPIRLAQKGGLPEGIQIEAVDHVVQGLRRARRRLTVIDGCCDMSWRGIVADLSFEWGRGGIPLGTGSCDAVLASLIISYVEEPGALLSEAHRVLRPGGRLVVSSVIRDADISSIYVESVRDLPAERAAELFGQKAARQWARLRQDFLNDASRIIDLEEFGFFRFWDGDELVRLVEEAGFVQAEAQPSFGRPPQAVVVSARRE